MLNYNLFQSKNSMKKQHYFCFLFTRIELLNDIQQTNGFFTNFKIYLLHRNSVIGQTKQILCITNGERDVIFEKEEIRCSLNEQNVRSCPKLEIKLTEILQSSEQRLIGSYQFGINNYIHISDKLNRHCVELSIQIGQNYAIYYEVFMDRIKEGVDQIKQEHQLSKNLIKDQDQIDDFLPEEMQAFPSRKKLKEIKLDSDDYITINQRYWSPTWLQMHSSPKKETKRRNLTKKNSINESFIIKQEQSTDQSIPEFKFAESTIDDLNKQQRLALSQASSHGPSILQPQNQESNDSENQEKTIEEMYQVIRSNSKITLPKPDHIFQINSEEVHENKVMRSSRKVTKIKNLTKYLVVFIIVLLVAMIGLYCFNDTNHQNHLQAKRQSKKHVKHNTI